ncbi:hypothetical protein SAMN04488544_1126 [Microlunatus sagamiharensis]|uniref:Uncharacterized protein n=1 Tax=Microlunatus sagamiharensis TaxID=546874 RepID=A0A1H2LZH4_9ACTN|nr:cell wall anchor protein [Microlunatus sagamiharensis]SDU86262.1 hypothetical protein SAMN04488544_1126 [Microlunatus sagamiharensis]
MSRRTPVLVSLAVLLGAAVWAPAPTAGAAGPAGPGITYRSSTTRSASAASSLSIARPAGTVPGDVLVARIANRAAVGADLTASGWTSVGSTRSAAMLKSWVLYRVVGASEPASYSFTQDATTSMAGSISAFSGVDTADPVDDFGGRVNGLSAIFAPPSVKSTTGNDLALWFGTQLANGSDCDDVAIAAPSTFVETSASCLVSQTAGLSLDVAQVQLGAPAAQPVAVLAPGATRSWTGSSRTLNTNITQALLLRPAATTEAAERYSSATVGVGSFTLPDSQLHEPSGLAASRTDPGVLYTHSESGDKTMVAISSTNAAVLERFTLSNTGQWDWEDIATGPCPAGSCIYAGDIGGVRDGGQLRANDYNIFRVAEPTVTRGTTAHLTSERFRFAYPDGAHNAEALMVHPTTGQVYVVTKERSGRSGVYTFPAGLPAPSATTVTTLTKVTTLQVPTYTATSSKASEQHKATWYAQVTAAAIHPAGDRFVLRTPYAVWEYRGTDSGSIDSALAAKPVALTAPVGEGQGEAIDYAPDGSAYFTLSERELPPFTLHRIDRV